MISEKIQALGVPQLGQIVDFGTRVVIDVHGTMGESGGLETTGELQAKGGKKKRAEMSNGEKRMDLRKSHDSLPLLRHSKHRLIVQEGNVAHGFHQLQLAGELAGNPIEESHMAFSATQQQMSVAEGGQMLR